LLFDFEFAAAALLPQPSAAVRDNKPQSWDPDRRIQGRALTWPAWDRACRRRVRRSFWWRQES